MSMTPERLAELDAVMAKATAGEWLADGLDIKLVDAKKASWGKSEANNVAAIVALHNAYPDLRAHIDAQAATIAKLQRCLLPVWMTIAEYECVGEPLPDSAVLLQFMGSGASDHVTAGEVRAALTGAA